MTIREGLLVVIAVMATLFAAAWARDVMRRRSRASGVGQLPTVTQFVIGFVTNFDTSERIVRDDDCGVRRAPVPDEDMPGTMIIGHDLPVVVQAFIFIAAVNVDPVLMLTLIAATVAGGWLGAGVVTRLPRGPIQIGMGVGLLLAAAFMALTQLGLFRRRNRSHCQGGSSFARGFFIFGAVLMIGIGNYTDRSVGASGDGSACCFPS
jgi:hypothetical protein